LSGKWHLGDFFYKGNTRYEELRDAYKKWPVSNPGMHGFDEWHSTEVGALLHQGQQQLLFWGVNL
jgi:hypothetical protein